MDCALLVFQQLRTQDWNTSADTAIPGTRTEPVRGSKMVSALKKPQKSGLFDVFLNMQLVLLMTNPLLLLFPREHLYTQQNTELA